MKATLRSAATTLTESAFLQDCRTELTNFTSADDDQVAKVNTLILLATEMRKMLDLEEAVAVNRPKIINTPYNAMSWENLPYNLIGLLEGFGEYAANNCNPEVQNFMAEVAKAVADVRGTLLPDEAQVVEEIQNVHTSIYRLESNINNYPTVPALRAALARVSPSARTISYMPLPIKNLEVFYDFTSYAGLADAIVMKSPTAALQIATIQTPLVPHENEIAAFKTADPKKFFAAQEEERLPSAIAINRAIVKAFTPEVQMAALESVWANASTAELAITHALAPEVQIAGINSPWSNINSINAAIPAAKNLDVITAALSSPHATAATATAFLNTPFGKNLDNINAVVTGIENAGIAHPNTASIIETLNNGRLAMIQSIFKYVQDQAALAQNP